MSLPRIIVIESDPKRRTLIRSFINEHVRAELFIADSVRAAIERMERRMPEVIITPALLSPLEGEELAAQIRDHQDARHVQLLTIPAFDMLGEPDVVAPRRFGLFRRQAPAVRRFDRTMVGAQIADGIERARQARREYAAWLAEQSELVEDEKRRQAVRALEPGRVNGMLMLTDGGVEADIDRRAAMRKPLEEFPWLSGGYLGWGGNIALVNISKTGVLIESGSKFVPGSTTDLHLTGPEANLVVPVRFVRSRVAAIDSSGVRYQAAAKFERELDLREPRRPGQPPTSPPQALVALLETALANAVNGAEPAQTQFVRAVRDLVGARDVQIRTGRGGSAGPETLFFEVPGDDRLRSTLQVVFEYSHTVTSSQMRLLRAAGWLAAVALEFDRPEPAASDSSNPVAMLEVGVA